ncbi:MAG: DoxX family protein [Bdellovibrionales bacterium]|nr:DoxX family protein [Bdellovibrionales bacterium]
MDAVKQFFSRRSQPTSVSIALLFLRVVVGSAFMFHGYGKILNPFEWMGPTSAMPGIFQFLAAISEFGGGLAFILGLLTVLAALGIASTMVVAVHFQMIIQGDPFISHSGGSYELALVYLVIALVIFATGAGRYSLDAKLFGERDADLQATGQS